MRLLFLKFCLKKLKTAKPSPVAPDGELIGRPMPVPDTLLQQRIDGAIRGLKLTGPVMDKRLAAALWRLVHRAEFHRAGAGGEHATHTLGVA